MQAAQNNPVSPHRCVTCLETTWTSQHRNHLLTEYTRKAAISKLKAHRAAFEATREITTDDAPRGSVDTNWRATNRIKYVIREEHSVFEREARMKAVEELKKGTAVTSWSVKGCLYRIIQALLRYLNLFTLLLSRLFFFEFPNNLRHLCTTMPWSIWPALVVLWGVCWMFYENADGRSVSQGMYYVHVSALHEGLTVKKKSRHRSWSPQSSSTLRRTVRRRYSSSESRRRRLPWR